jgi:hypothetical protein
LVATACATILPTDDADLANPSAVKGV